MLKDSYDVAISYASEDTDLADVVANRLRQDGYRCFYNPNRLHKLLGLPISEALLEIYSSPNTQIVALISQDYLQKEYPQQEFAAAMRGGVHRVIPIRVGAAAMPSQLEGLSYASTEASSHSAIAIHVSQALETRLGSHDVVPMAASGRELSSETVVALDNPRWPYSVSNVEFFDSGESYYVDVNSDRLEFDEPHGFLNRGLGEISAENVFSHITLDMAQQAKAEVRALIAQKEATGWPIFNGKKFGVARVRRTRTAEAEHHRFIVNVYETDYFTSLFSKKLYGLLSPDRSIRVDRNGSFSEYSGLLTSFGFDILLFTPLKEEPHILIAKRSKNVANSAVSGGLWHVSMNEGVSASDRYASEFDAASTFFRGFDEELNLRRSAISRAELFEPFLEYNNFELGMAGAAYTSVSVEEMVREAELASDRVLETASLTAIPATAEAIETFYREEEQNMTNLLAFCLRSVLARSIGSG